MSKNKKKFKKSTRETVKKRLVVVYELKLLGYQDHEILNYVNNGGKDGKDKELKWDIKYGTLRYYVRQARNAADEYLERNLETIFKDAVRRWSFMIRKFHREGDNTNMVKATKELDELLGLRTTNINLSGLLNINDVTGMTEDQLDEEILKMEALTGKDFKNG